MLTNKCFKEQKFISGFSYELTFLFSPLKISLSCILFNLFFFACLTLFIFLIQFQGFFFPFFFIDVQIQLSPFSHHHFPLPHPPPPPTDSSTLYVSLLAEGISTFAKVV